MVLELEHNRPRDFTFAICQILDCGAEARSLLEEQIKRTRRLAVTGRTMHDFSIFFDKYNKTAITYMSAPKELGTELANRLEIYCHMKKYQNKYAVWLGLASIADFPALAPIGVIADFPWEQSDEMDEKLKIFEEYIKPMHDKQ